MIVSQCLDDDLKLHLAHLKYGGDSLLDFVDTKSRRYSMIDFQLIDRLKKSSSNQRRFDFNEDNSDDVDDNLSTTLHTSDLKELRSSSKEEYLNEMKAKTPGFVSHLSKEGQYALLKSLEDTLFNEMEFSHRELADRMTRISTAKYEKRGSKLSFNFF